MLVCNQTSLALMYVKINVSVNVCIHIIDAYLCNVHGSCKGEDCLHAM